MRELAATGFMSNRGRQIVASFLTRDMSLDWRMGAAHFEELLLDFDPCSNFGNWCYAAGEFWLICWGLGGWKFAVRPSDNSTYKNNTHNPTQPNQPGVGSDPREDRYFSIPKQGQTYDPEVRV